MNSQRVLVRAMLLSLAASLVTMALKTIAAAITGSVSLLSDALESGVNLVAAVIGLIALRTAAKPPDREHQFGHGKAEYLSAGIEGGMIFTAAAVIVWSAVGRLANPVPLDQTGVGMALSAVAAVINFAVGLTLVRVGRRHRSLTVEADGKHLLTDVWTSVGVLAGIGLIAVVEVPILDPIIALMVGVNVLVVGYRLLKRSVIGLLDAALPAEDAAKVAEILRRHCQANKVEFGAIRTRESGRQRFIYLTMFVPGEWSVRQSHELADLVEKELGAELPGSVSFTHVEPLESIDGPTLCSPCPPD